MPVADERFEGFLGKDNDVVLTHVTIRAKFFCRAIGRFPARCLRRQRPPRDRLLPKLLWNGKKTHILYCFMCMEMDERIHHNTKPLKFLKLTVALRDCKPTDSRYSSLALGMNLLGMGVKPKTVEYTKKTCESPKKFRHKIEEKCISSKTIWLDSCSQGLLVFA